MRKQLLFVILAAFGFSAMAQKLQISAPAKESSVYSANSRVGGGTPEPSSKYPKDFERGPEFDFLYSADGPYGIYDRNSEILDKRDAFSKHYLNTDGKVTAVITAGPQHYFENGLWHTIRNNILPETGMPGFGWSNKSNEYKTYYGNNVAAGIRFETPQATFSFKNQKLVYLSADLQVIGEVPLSNFSSAFVNKEVITYKNAAPALDFKIEQTSGGFRTSYILNTLPANIPYEAAFIGVMEQAEFPSSWEIFNNGGFTLITDPTGEGRVKISSINIFEENFEQGAYEKGKITLGPDGKMLFYFDIGFVTNPMRTFPVVLDPTITYTPNASVYWTGTVDDDSGCDFSTDNDSDENIRVGFDDGTFDNDYYDSYAKFNINALPSNACIQNAYSRFFQWRFRNVEAGNKCWGNDDVLTYYYGGINPITFDPVPASCDAISAAIASAPVYTNYNVFSGYPLGTGNGWKDFTFNLSGVVTAARAVQNYMTLSFDTYGSHPDPGFQICCFCTPDNDDWIDFYGWNNASRPQLVVTYETPFTAPAAANVSVNNVCPGTSITLTQSGGTNGSVGSWFWYSGSCGGTLVGSSSATDAALTISAPTVPTTYFVRGQNICGNTVCQSVTFTPLTNSVAPTGISASVNPICQGGSTLLSVNGGSLGSGANWQWFTGSCGGTAAGTGTAINVSPGTTTTYFVRAQGTCNTTGCASLTVTVNTPTNGGSTSVSSANACINTTVTVNLSGQNGTVVNWEMRINGGSWTNIGSAGLTSITSPTLSTVGLYEFRALVQNSPCSSQYSSITSVNVVAASVGGTATPALSSVCLNGNTTISVAGITGTVVAWERQINGGGWVNIGNAGLTNIPTGVMNVSGSWQYRAIIQNSPCSSTLSSIATVNVSAPSVGGSASAVSTLICQGSSTTVSLAGQTGTVLFWERQVNGGGFNNIGNAGLLSFNTGPLAPGTYDYRAVVQNSPCAGATSTSVTVTVSSNSVGGTAIPTVTQICEGGSTNISLTGNNGAVLFWEQQVNGGGWYNIGNAGASIISTGTLVAGLNEFRAVVQNGGCPSVNSSIAAITVDPTTVGGSVSANVPWVCEGATATLTLAGNTGTITQWERQVNGGGWISIGNAGVNPYTTGPLSPSGTHEFRALVTSGLCAAQYSASATVTVNQNDDPSFFYNSSVFCQGAPNAAPTITTPGGTFTAAPAGLSINSSNGIIDLSASAAGTYVITHVTSGICPATATQSITIGASANTSFSYSNLSYCLNAASNPIPTVTTSGGTFTTLNPGLIFANASTGEINLALSQPGSYFVQYSIGGSCPSSNTVTVILQAPGNSAFTYAASSYCVGGTNPLPTVGQFGGTFSASPFGLIFANNQTGEINLNTSTPGTYTVTYNSGGPCPTTTTQTITINATPDPLFFYNTATFCTGAANPTPFVSTPGGGFTASPAGIIFNNPATGQINLAASLPGNYVVTYSFGGVCPQTYSQNIAIVANQNATFSYSQNNYCQSGNNPVPTVHQIGGIFTSSPAGLVFANAFTGEINLAASSGGTYTVTYTVPGICVGTYTQNITITAGAVASLSYATNSFCNNGPNAVATATPAGGTFTASPVGLFFADAVGTINVAASVAGAYTVNYTAPGACGTTASYNVVIVNAPQALIQPVANLCTNSSPEALSASPSGGTWSGGAYINTSGIFDPAVSGAGTFPVTYSVTGAGGCVATASYNVNVNAAPSVSITPAGPFCSDAGAQALSATPLGGTWSGNPFVSVNGLFFPSISGAGVFPIQYSISSNGCTSSASTTVVVQAAPAPVINPAPALCSNSPIVGLSATPSGGTWSGGAYINPSGNFNPALAAVGNNIVTYTLTSGVCTTQVSATVSVGGVPNVNILTPTPFCQNDSPEFLITNLPGGVFFGGNYVSGTGLFSPNLAALGNNIVIYSITGNNGCVGTDTVQVVVNANPNASVSYPGTTCEDGAPFAMTVTTPGGSWSGGPYINAGIFDPSVAGVGSHLVTYTVSSGQGCSATESIFVTVEPKPVAIYTHQPNGLTVYFTDLSLYADSWLWNFGDGSPEVTDQSPTHLFPDNGLYLVRQIAFNECGSDTLIRNVLVNKTVNISENGETGTITLFPNPTDSYVQISATQLEGGMWKFSVVDIAGKEVMMEEVSVNGGEFQKTADVTILNPGVYFIRLSNGKMIHTAKFVKL